MVVGLCQDGHLGEIPEVHDLEVVRSVCMVLITLVMVMVMVMVMSMVMMSMVMVIARGGEV